MFRLSYTRPNGAVVVVDTYATEPEAEGAILPYIETHAKADPEIHLCSWTVEML